MAKGAIRRQARICIAGEPLFQKKRILGAAHHAQKPVPAPYRDAVTVTRDQHIRLPDQRRPDNRERQHASPHEAQRRAQQSEDDEADTG